MVEQGSYGVVWGYEVGTNSLQSQNLSASDPARLDIFIAPTNDRIKNGEQIPSATEALACKVAELAAHVWTATRRPEMDPYTRRGAQCISCSIL